MSGFIVWTYKTIENHLVLQYTQKHTNTKGNFETIFNVTPGNKKRIAQTRNKNLNTQHDQICRVFSCGIMNPLKLLGFYNTIWKHANTKRSIEMRFVEKENVLHTPHLQASAEAEPQYPSASGIELYSALDK